MDKLIFERKPDEQKTPQYAHVRVSVKHWKEVGQIAEACNLSIRQVSDALLAFALERVTLEERPLYKMNQDDIGEDAEAEDED